jgi:hypothetical protein
MQQTSKYFTGSIKTYSFMLLLQLHAVMQIAHSYTAFDVFK